MCISRDRDNNAATYNLTGRRVKAGACESGGIFAREKT